MPKNFLLDTSVLLYDPDSIYNFEENNILIPITVIKELDNFKTGTDSINHNAREVTRHLEKFRNKGDLKSGVDLPEEGQIKVLYDESINQNQKNDQIILEYANKTDSILVSKDMNLRVQAETVGVKPEDYTSGQSNVRKRDIKVVNMSRKTMDLLYAQGSIDEGLLLEKSSSDEDSLSCNEYLVGKSNGSSILLRKRGETGKVTKVSSPDSVYSLTPRNKEQYFAIDAMLDPSVKLVALSGKAGTGKTLCALAAGLEQTKDSKQTRGRYEQTIVARPTVPMGRDLGYIPGQVEDKIAPWMKPIKDNLEFLVNERDKNEMKYLQNFGLLDIEPLTYIRGRSMPDRFLIIDECQNTSPHELKTIITRAGEGTKIILTGDPEQIDASYLDEDSNGLSHVIEKMHGEPEFAFVNLVKGERSPLAEKAAQRL